MPIADLLIFFYFPPTYTPHLFLLLPVFTYHQYLCLYLFLLSFIIELLFTHQLKMLRSKPVVSLTAATTRRACTRSLQRLRSRLLICIPATASLAQLHSNTRHNNIQQHFIRFYSQQIVERG